MRHVLRRLAVLTVLSSIACASAPKASPSLAMAVACRAAATGSGAPASSLVRWHGAFEPGDRVIVDRWCATVGPAVVERPARLPVTPPETLAVVSWNMHVGGGDLSAFVRALREGRFTSDRPVDRFVILVQEAFRRGPGVPGRVTDPEVVPAGLFPRPLTSPRRDVVEVASEEGLSLFYAPSMRNGWLPGGKRGEDRGNAILSTEPLAGLTAIELPFERQRRVAVAATVLVASSDGTSVPLRVASAHLDTLADARRLWIFAEGSRARQARGLLEALSNEPLAVLGADFNSWLGDDEAAVVEARRAFPQTPWRERRATFHAGLRLDYVFFRLPDGWVSHVERLDDRFGSDHHPLLGWVMARPVDAPLVAGR